ncbi:response regulator transcription factor [Lacticaseibacillus zeae]|uniref:Response regulator transcription factor n=1 Tax=Lacticaseibacillus zeae subsp. silagei TaxID=3068307 RepID=A0ABD7ZC48_LACZE|nr:MULTISPECIES: response regulator transcription factor [Lacticaseibacillus]MDE3314963.1 response regulator transcription factor [Lacticaseibacillus zeae]OFR95912.1 DNA-binding response regulator [Lactobacillus sp. HMSC068F07]WLV84744.1 response regulator transcription factor [Lacticaseibacillus sp. NCIMB 15475]WLV85465.1 response regulator transcription factor [Lacticaseibacillus sp. NCIMB 15474]
MAKILIVEDHKDIQALLQDVLAPTYEVVQAFDGIQALTQFHRVHPDLVILDLMLPNVTGESVLTTIRKTSQVPVLVLTAIQDKQKTVALLKQGANDYLTKPFDIDELLARVQVQLRQNKPITAQEDDALQVGEILLDPKRHAVTVNHQPLTLPKKEYAILALMMRDPHQVFDKRQLYEQVWGEPFLNADNTLNVHISNLRTKINDLAQNPKYIISIWGIGVRLV